MKNLRKYFLFRMSLNWKIETPLFVQWYT